MPNSFKNTWWIYLLIAGGGIFFFLSLHPGKPQSDQGVVLNDIFHGPSAPVVKKVDPVPPMAIVTTPVNGQETDFTIQVYSFQSKDRAQAALQALKNNGYQAFMIMSDLGEKGTWYRVRVGGIVDEAAAHKTLDEIRKSYNSGFILKPRT
jgi:cell division septation protein DedD